MIKSHARGSDGFYSHAADASRNQRTTDENESERRYGILQHSVIFCARCSITRNILQLKWRQAASVNNKITVCLCVCNNHNKCQTSHTQMSTSHNSRVQHILLRPPEMNFWWEGGAQDDVIKNLTSLCLLNVNFDTQRECMWTHQQVNDENLDDDADVD